MDKHFIETLQKAQIELQKEYSNALLAKNLTQANAIKSKIQSIIVILKKAYKDWATLALAEEYVGGYNAIDSTLDIATYALGEVANDTSKLSLLNQAISMMATPHKEAINSLIDTSYGLVSISFDGLEKNYNLLVGTTLTHKIRERIAIDIIKGSGLHSSKKSITSMLENTNTIIRDSMGRKWNLGTYAEMVIRTERIRAHNTAIVNRGIEMGITKFQVDEQTDCCDICQSHNGKIYDIKDGTIELPPYHPNCRGTIIPLHNFIPHPTNDIVTDPRYWESGIKEDTIIDDNYLKRKGLSPKEIDAIDHYNHFGYRTINDDIIAGKKTSDIALLSSGLSKLDKYHGKVFRLDHVSTNVWDTYYAHLEVGDRYIHKPFMSTSYSRKSILEFSNYHTTKPVSIRMQIISKNGRYTGNHKEKEILFKKGTTFKVQGIKSTKNYHLFYLEEDD